MSVHYAADERYSKDELTEPYVVSLDEVHLTWEERTTIENMLSKSERSLTMFAMGNKACQILKTKFKTAMDKLKDTGPTSKLWVQYFCILILPKEWKDYHQKPIKVLTEDCSESLLGNDHETNSSDVTFIKENTVAQAEVKKVSMTMKNRQASGPNRLLVEFLTADQNYNCS
ncbi:hypothetical protein ILUMI_02592, partial [Ignelater luminosus]